MSEAHIVDVRIIQPGGRTGRYLPEGDGLRLEAVLPPEEPLPFDVAVLPTVWTPFDEPFRVLVVGSVSHPAETWLTARLLGAWQREEEPPFLVAAPEADPAAPLDWEMLSARQRQAVLDALQSARPGKWRWLDVAAVEPVLHAGAHRYQQRKENRRLHTPAWQPLRTARRGSYTAVDQYTPAEYTFFDLPYRFQEYVGDALAPDERILYAVRRPAMSSLRHRSWLRREHLQEGVLLLTTHRLIHLAELIPPDAANVRYGFREVVGALERLRAVSLRRERDGLLLITRWAAADGEQEVVWEAPAFAAAALHDLLSYLQAFVENRASRALQRATPPPSPEHLPPLVDTAANDPDESKRLTAHFAALLAAARHPDETVLAWAALPRWFQPKVGAQALVVSTRRVFLLPPGHFELPLQTLATLEYTGSILESYLVFTTGQGERHRVRFPYPAKGAFRACFEAAWRAAAVLPLRP